MIDFEIKTKSSFFKERWCLETSPFRSFWNHVTAVVPFGSTVTLTIRFQFTRSIHKSQSRIHFNIECHWRKPSCKNWTEPIKLARHSSGTIKNENRIIPHVSQIFCHRLNRRKYREIPSKVYVRDFQHTCWHSRNSTLFKQSWSFLNEIIVNANTPAFNDQFLLVTR